MLNFKLRYQQFKNSKTKLVSKLVLLLFSNKRVAFLGHPVQEWIGNNNRVDPVLYLTLVLELNDEISRF